MCTLLSYQSQGDMLNRFVISSRVLAKEVSKHTGTVEIVKMLMKPMKEFVPKDSGISLRAGMHNGLFSAEPYLDTFSYVYFQANSIS